MSDLGDWTDYDESEGEESRSGADVDADRESAPVADRDGDPDSGSPAEDVADPSTESAGTTGGDADSLREPDPDGADGSFQRVDLPEHGADRGIGTLSASEGLRIAEDERDTCLRAYVTVGNRRRVRIGSYLVADYPDGERLFARVAGLEYAQEFRSDDATEIHARRAMRQRGVDEQDYKFMAGLAPVAVLYEREDGDDEWARRMPDRVPRPETVVRRATERTEIKTGLALPTDGVFLGHLAVGGEKVHTAADPPTVDYRLRDDYDAGDPLVFRHTLVAGGTGSGKTHVAKNVLRQYLGRTYRMDDGRTPELAVVQFDPQDEYAQMHDDPDLERETARRYDREGITRGGYDDTLAFVPQVGGASYAADHHRAEQVPFTLPFSMVRSRPWLVAGSSLNDNQYQALRLLLDRFFDGHGPGGTYEEFRSFLDDPRLREELDESGRVHEATFDAVRRRAQGFGDVFDRGAPSITDRVHRFVRPGGLTVVPTYHVNDTRATETVVLALASLLVDEKLSNDPRHDRIKDTPLILGMDEAHSFLTDAESVQARRVIRKFTEAAKQGRKERLGLFLVTQDPQDVADAVFKQVNTTVVLNLNDEDAINAVNVPAALESKVPYMEQGQMVVHSPDNSEPVEIIGLPDCLTRHGRD